MIERCSRCRDDATQVPQVSSIVSARESKETLSRDVEGNNRFNSVVLSLQAGMGKPEALVMSKMLMDVQLAPSAFVIVVRMVGHGCC